MVGSFKTSYLLLCPFLNTKCSGFFLNVYLIFIIKKINMHNKDLKFFKHCLKFNNNLEFRCQKGMLISYWPTLRLGKPQKSYFLLAKPLRPYQPPPLELIGHIFEGNFFLSFKNFLLRLPLCSFGLSYLDKKLPYTILLNIQWIYIYLSITLKKTKIHL